MQLFQIPLTTDNYRLILFGDNQDGNVAQHKEGLRSCIDYILSGKNRFAWHMGDACEGFWIDDPRYQIDTCKSPPFDQMDSAVNDYAPLAKAGRLLGMLLGNHELALMKKAGNMTEQITGRLRLLGKGVYPHYGTYSSKIGFVDKHGLQFNAYLTHGRKTISSVSPDPGRRRAYMEFALQRQLEFIFGDCLLMAKGHAHKLLVKRPQPTLYMTSENNKLYHHYTVPGGSESYIHPENRWYACTASFLKTFELGANTYSEIAEYPPVELGYIEVVVENRVIVDVLERKV